MSKIVKLVQGSEEWHRHRKQYRNASETAAVMGLSPWLTRYQLWELKTQRQRQEVNFAMQRGTELEPIARQAYEDLTGSVMEPLVMVHGEYSASLDGMSLDGDLILEIKCPLRGKDSDTWQLAMERRLEPHYRFQVQHQLMVTGARSCHFYVFDGKEGVVVDVLPNTKDFDEIRSAWDEFWRYVVSDSSPPLTPMDSLVRQDEAWRQAAANYIACKQAADEAAKRADDAKLSLAALATHTSERGHGVAVCRFRRGPTATKDEVRVTVLRQEGERC